MTAVLDPHQIQDDTRPVPKRRRGWLVAGLVVAVIFVGLGAWSAAGALSREPVHIHRTWSGAIHSLDIHTGDGSVTLVGSNAPGATVDASGWRGLSSPRDDETLVGDTLRIRSSCPQSFGTNVCSLSYRITVPSDIALTVDAGDGSVHVGGISGGMQLSTSDGSISVTNPSGPLRLHSGDGRIRVSGATSRVVVASSSDGSVRLAFAAPPDSVDAHSSDGSVAIDLPQSNDAYRLNATSSDGRVTTPIRTDPDSPRRISATSSDGSVSVSYTTG
jgi:hypothetical protein